MDGNTLTIIFWEDEYTVGEYEVKGNTLSYDYTWYYVVDGEVEKDPGEFKINLTRKK